MQEEKVRWELHKNATGCFEQVLEAAPYKTAVVRPLTSHLINHLSKMNKTFQALTHKQHFLIDSYTQLHQFWLTNKELPTTALCWQWIHTHTHTYIYIYIYIYIYSAKTNIHPGNFRSLDIARGVLVSTSLKCEGLTICPNKGKRTLLTKYHWFRIFPKQGKSTPLTKCHRLTICSKQGKITLLMKCPGFTIYPKQGKNTLLTKCHRLTICPKQGKNTPHKISLIDYLS